MLLRRSGDIFGRVNPYVPLAVIAAGAVCFALGSRAIGVGIGVGACLACVNGVLLSRRVEIAADTGDFARAVMVMQVGLLLSFIVIAVVTIVLVRISLGMAVASAAGFAVAQLGILAAFYWTRGRQDVVTERNAP
jgi:hypothetical protein